jgi:hypothetical protein
MIAFELNTLLPAVISVTLHSLSHIALFDLLNCICEKMRRDISDYFDIDYAEYVNAVTYLTIFFIGIAMMRITGDIYWWSNDVDYLSIKFDYHNRIRLGMWDAKIIKMIRSYSVARAALCMIGYYLCYVSLYPLYIYYGSFYDEKAKLLADLPSLKHDNGICVPFELQSKTLELEIVPTGEWKYGRFYFISIIQLS